MRVRMKVKLTGSLNGQAYLDAGKQFEVPDVAGANLCDRGFAEPVAQKASDREEKAVPKKRAEKRG